MLSVVYCSFAFVCLRGCDMENKHHISGGNWPRVERKEQITDEGNVHWPVTSRTNNNIDKIHRIGCANRRQTVKSKADQVNNDRDGLREILTEGFLCLNTWKVRAKMMPNEQKESKVELCADMLKRRHEVLGRIVISSRMGLQQSEKVSYGSKSIPRLVLEM